MSSKKQRILDAALQLFAERGIESTATAQIAATAGVAKGTLFHHFENKAALVDELFVHLKQSLRLALFGENENHAGCVSTEPALSDSYLQLKSVWLSGMHWAMANPVAMAFFCQVHFHPASHHRNMSIAETFAPLEERIILARHAGVVAALDLIIIRDFCHHHFLHCAHFVIDAKHAQCISQLDYINTSFDMLWRAIGGQTPPFSDSKKRRR
ncbi:TetR/AcrR family transcriptional regulator [Motilimonas pumila]|uniref:TetR/AcrR family transcriptional regulator n=1 Tax=Motilimonas pumila TaxID=2303987 RepID=A0A418YDJ7_9GAMM|nr:TetR/AcrR family transcriptional regulator [Motilimonas pumila]RJG42571.1 TetR/AcrR family transcriptional regulator [Motilimonas pumila]